jgi:hypothetical protein
MSTSVAELLNDAKNAAGERAVAAARQEKFAKAREWQALAAEIERLFREAIAAMMAP